MPFWYYPALCLLAGIVVGIIIGGGAFNREINRLKKSSRERGLAASELTRKIMEALPGKDPSDG